MKNAAKACLIVGVILVACAPRARVRAETPDAVGQAQTTKAVAVVRPEQQKTPHDLSNVFGASAAQSTSAALKGQANQGQYTGFDFYRDALGATRPGEPSAALVQADVAAKAGVMAAQARLLADRYDLTPRTLPGLVMSRGKPIPIGPAARLRGGVKSWDELAGMTPDAIRGNGLFPYPALPHVKQSTGGMVFPKMQIEMFARLQRFDIDFDLPDAFLPEFPPAMFLQSRPELGDVSRGEIVSINNYYALFKDILTPVQLDGLRLLLTPFPQEEFNPTDDRKSAQAALGVTCLDCHVNGHTTGQFHLNPDNRPENRRFRIDTVSLRGMFAQKIHGSKRSLRSVEDFTEFEQRTAYFNGDPIHAMKKGVNFLDRVQVTNMAQMQNMFDFPPAPKLDLQGHLDPSKASQAELRGERLFNGKAQCASCHPPPFYLDNLMHDLRTERFVDEVPLGPMKTFTLRGIKDSPPYMHDGRCPTIEDTVEFFNLVQGLHLTGEEKGELVAFLRQL
jgi:cytochrome c peroxidase